jgi:hypothetical protein
MRTLASSMISAAVALSLAACGGGGGGGDQPTTYAVSAAQRHLFSDTRSWTTTGSALGSNFTLTMAVAPLAAAPFPVNGRVASRSRQTITLQQAGQPADVTVSTYYFDDADLSIVGWDNDAGTCSVATQNTALPETAAAGASGDYYRLSDLNGCAGNSGAVGTTLATWSVESDSGVTLLCSNSTGKDSAGAVLGTISTCIEVAADGTLGAKARITIAALGVSVVTRNF